MNYIWFVILMALQQMELKGISFIMCFRYTTDTTFKYTESTSLASSNLLTL